jgi:hypothetical protein
MPDDLIRITAMKNFLNCLSSEFAEDFLQLLLNLMSIVLLFDHNYQKNILGFNGRYQFKSKNGDITVAALFKNNRMEIREEQIPNPDITVLFKDGKTLMGYILSPKPDILGSILHQEVSLDGNLNYLYKFAFMAKRLQLMAGGKI